MLIAGIPAAEEIKTLRGALNKEQLIFVTDYAAAEQQSAIVSECGTDGFIPRPFFASRLISAANSAKSRKKDTAGRANSIFTGLKFLCAEDTDLNAEILKGILEIRGAFCTVCTNGEETVKVFEQAEPGEFDAILMDIQMPKMNGLDAARAIRIGKILSEKQFP